MCNEMTITKKWRKYNITVYSQTVWSNNYTGIKNEWLKKKLKVDKQKDVACPKMKVKLGQLSQEEKL